MQIHDVFKHFLYIILPFSSDYEIPKPDITEIALAGGFKQLLAVNIIAAYRMGEQCLIEVGHIREYYVSGDINLLRLHIFRNAACRIKFSHSVGNERQQIIQKCNITDCMTLYNIFQYNRIEHSRQIFLHQLFIFKPHIAQSGQPSIIQIEHKCVVTVGKIVKLKKFSIAKRQDVYFLKTPTQQGA